MTEPTDDEYEESGSLLTLADFILLPKMQQEKDENERKEKSDGRREANW